MLLLIATTFITMKLVVLVASYAHGKPTLSPLRWLAFTIAWPGMRPAVWRRQSSQPLDVAQHVAWGLACVALGVILIYCAILLSRAYENRWAVTAIFLVGCSFVLHFGLFRLVVAGWRMLGVDCRPMFRAPFLATSLREFWGNRWNHGFTEMLQETVYRPLQRSVGRPRAGLASFAASGLLHEVAISLPVGGGEAREPRPWSSDSKLWCPCG